MLPRSIRYTFTSGPKFNSTANEYLIVQGPTLVAALALPTLSANLLMIVRNMGASVSSKSGSGNTATLRRLALNMINFAAVSVICIAVQLSAVLTYLPKAIEFGTKMSQFQVCASSGVPTKYWNANGTLMPGSSQYVFPETDLNTTLDKCGDFISMAPPLSTVQLLLVSQSLPVFLFGGLFALPALRQLHSTATNKIRSMTSKSAVSSAAA